MMKNVTHWSARLARAGRWSALLLASGVLLSACDLGVTNPAVIGDEDLNDIRVVNSLVSGAISDVYLAAMGVNAGRGLFVGGALLTDELVHSGNNTSYLSLMEGTPDDELTDGRLRWAYASRARWTTEDHIRRVSEILEAEGIDPAGDERIATLRLWAGHANRLMGDNFCQAVIDGGPLEEHTVFYDRAEDHFTRAIELGQAQGMDSLVLAAHGGRAQTRMMRGDWAGAVSDAGELQTDYLLELELSPSARVRNSLVWQVYQSSEMTLWGTPFADWGLNVSDTASTGDPRVEFVTARDSLDNYVTGPDDRRPFWQAIKFTLSSDNIAFIRGTEMRLIEAEAALVAGDRATAVQKINEVREFRNTVEGGALGLEPVTASSDAEAWELLQRERALELFLEGRRLPDLRRWAAAGVPVNTTVVRHEVVGEPAEADLEERQPVLDVDNLCLPISRDERVSNPNISS